MTNADIISTSAATTPAAVSSGQSQSTQAIAEAVVLWGRKRWPNARVIRELVLGERRADLVFVLQSDIIGIEIKSATDTMDRLSEQVREYGRYVPEVWIAIAPKWTKHDTMRRQIGGNIIVVDPAETPAVLQWHARKGRQARDELVCSRLIELLWHEELMRIAKRMQILTPLNVRMPKIKIASLLARLMTGNEIICEVCRELRGRALVGNGSDKAIG